MSRYEEVYRQEFPALGVISTWFGVVLIGVTAVAHIFVTEGSGQSGTGPLMDGLQFILTALILASCLYLALRAGSRSLKLAAVPLVINVGTLIIVQFVPFASLWQEARFQWYGNSYNEIVRQVESGAILPNEQGLALLPARYRHLSEDHVIMVDERDGQTRIFFFTRRRTSWNFSGYMYRSGNTPPQPGDFGGRWWTVVKKRPHWFFCSSY